MMNCCPTFSVSFCAKMRATMSAPAPGEVGTMTRTALVGYWSAAPALAALRTRKSAAKGIAPDDKRVMWDLLGASIDSLPEAEPGNFGEVRIRAGWARMTKTGRGA